MTAAKGSGGASGGSHGPRDLEQLVRDIREREDRVVVQLIAFDVITELASEHDDDAALGAAVRYAVAVYRQAFADEDEPRVALNAFLASRPQRTS